VSMRPVEVEPLDDKGTVHVSFGGGDAYRGEWDQEKPHGQGTYYSGLPAGIVGDYMFRSYCDDRSKYIVYDGQWKHGKADGEGKNKWYEGRWREGQWHGSGKYTPDVNERCDKIGDVVEGVWRRYEEEDHGTWDDALDDYRFADDSRRTPFWLVGEGNSTRTYRLVVCCPSVDAAVAVDALLYDLLSPKAIQNASAKVRIEDAVKIDAQGLHGRELQIKVFDSLVPQNGSDWLLTPVYFHATLNLEDIKELDLSAPKIGMFAECTKLGKVTIHADQVACDAFRCNNKLKTAFVHESAQIDDDSFPLGCKLTRFSTAPVRAPMAPLAPKVAVEHPRASQKLSSVDKVEPDPTDVLEVCWPLLRIPAHSASVDEAILTEAHSREEWIESGFLLRIVRDLVDNQCVSDVAKRPSAVALSTLEVYWMRWTSHVTFVVVFVHPSKGRKSLMGVPMTLSEVYKIDLTREWIENLDNTIINICRPKPPIQSGAKFTLPLETMYDLGEAILFPRKDYQPKDRYALMAYTELWKRCRLDSEPKYVVSLSVETTWEDACPRPAHEPPEYRRAGRKGFALFGCGMALTAEACDKEDEAGAYVTENDAGATRFLTMRRGVRHRAPKLDDTTRELVVGRELSWLSAFHCSLHPRRWFDQTEETAIHALVKKVGKFRGQVTMKRFHLRPLEPEEIVYWVIYPLITKHESPDDFSGGTLPTSIDYLHRMEAAATDSDLRTHYSEILGDSPRAATVVRHLSDAAKEACFRGNRDHLLLAATMTQSDVDAHRASFKEKFAALESEKERRRREAQEKHPEEVETFHRDAYRFVQFNRTDDPIAITKYKEAFEAFRIAEKEKQEMDRLKSIDGLVVRPHTHVADGKTQVTPFFKPADISLALVFDRFVDPSGRNFDESSPPLADFR
jgi:hypothetical protein